jgi:hypothetical protein
MVPRNLDLLLLRYGSLYFRKEATQDGQRQELIRHRHRRKRFIGMPFASQIWRMTTFVLPRDSRRCGTE